MTESLDTLSQRLTLSLDAFYAGVVRGEQERLAEEEREAQERAREASVTGANVVAAAAYHDRPASLAGHSDAWWYGVSTCESGNGSGSSNLYGIMDFRAGQMSPADQLAWAKDIWAGFGDGAWAQSCQASGYRNAPDG